MLLNCVWYNNIHLLLFSALQLYVIVAVLLFCLQVYWDVHKLDDFHLDEMTNLLSGVYVYFDPMAY